jgi:hypothetical protein
MAQRRRSQSLALKLRVALLQLGLDPQHVRLDHRPPLGLRARRMVNGIIVYEPDENDARYLQFVSTAEHAELTTGRRGTSKLSKRGGDISEIAKLKRLEEKREQHERFKRHLLQLFPLIPPPPIRPKRKWPKRKLRS